MRREAGGFYALGKDQAKQEIKKWLKASFKTERDRTVAREFVFRQYQQFCIDQNIESTTQSAFGRILKDVFPGLKQRRLGPRNNNKMHYLHLGLRSEAMICALADFEQRTSSSGPPSPSSPSTSSPHTSNSEASSPELLPQPRGAGGEPTADGVRTGLTRARLGELESASIDDHHWDSITALASSPFEMSPLQPDPTQPRLTPGLYQPHYRQYHAPEALPPPPAEGVQDHPWVMLPFLASVQLLEGVYDKRNPCLSLLADFVREFMRNGDIRGFADLETEVVFHFTLNRGDVGMHHAMFVVAWWARLLCINEREGRSRAAHLLRLVLPDFGQFDSKLAVPIIELLRSCEFVGTTLLPAQGALDLQVAFSDWRKQESEWSLPDPCPPHLKHTVGKILFHANQAISLENTCERAQSAELLVSGLMSASQPLLAVSLHELDCHGMLGMVVNVLHGLRQRHDKQLSSLPELLERVKEFEGLYARLHNAVAGVTAPHVHYRASSTLPPPQDQLVVPLLTAAPLSEATVEYHLLAAPTHNQPKIERLDSDDQHYFSTPSSPLSNTTAPPLFNAASAATSPFFPQHTHVPSGHHYMSSPSSSSSSPSFAHGHRPHTQHHHNEYPPWPVMPHSHPLLQPPPHQTYFPPPPFSHCTLPVPPEWSAPPL